MGDRVSTNFSFSGNLPQAHVAELERIILDEGGDPTNLSAVLEFEEVNYAQHDALWGFAASHNLDWAMSWSQGGGFGPGMIISRSGVEIECGCVNDEPALTSANIEVMRLGDLNAVLAFLTMFEDPFAQLPPLCIIP